MPRPKAKVSVPRSGAAAASASASSKPTQSAKGKPRAPRVLAGKKELPVEGTKHRKKGRGRKPTALFLKGRDPNHAGKPVLTYSGVRAVLCHAMQEKRGTEPFFLAQGVTELLREVLEELACNTAFRITNAERHRSENARRTQVTPYVMSHALQEELAKADNAAYRAFVGTVEDRSHVYPPPLRLKYRR